jgi:hypothetical protein
MERDSDSKKSHPRSVDTIGKSVAFWPSLDQGRPAGARIGRGRQARVITRRNFSVMIKIEQTFFGVASSFVAD